MPQTPKKVATPTPPSPETPAPADTAEALNPALEEIDELASPPPTTPKKTRARAAAPTPFTQSPSKKRRMTTYSSFEGFIEDTDMAIATNLRFDRESLEYPSIEKDPYAYIRQDGLDKKASHFPPSFLHRYSPFTHRGLGVRG
jgi:hypothetical protein